MDTNGYKWSNGGNNKDSNRGLILMEEEAAKQRLKRRPRGVALASGGLGG